MADRPPRYRYAVILAGMRTGSNLLEESLGLYGGVETHGEVFNPHFFGRPGQRDGFGLSMSGRDADPLRVIEAMTDAGAGLPVFRLFQDHDRRVLDHVLSDAGAAKILLDRPAIEAWVSLKIARTTGQWWLGDERRAKTARVAFDPADFESFAKGRAAFFRDVKARLRHSGQTAFALTYDDLFDGATLDGLATWLGLSPDSRQGRVRARVQNPTPLEDRLIAPETVAAELAGLAAADLGAMRDFEPSRGPFVRGFVAVEGDGVLYMPIRGAAPDPVAAWLSAQKGGPVLLTDMRQKDLRAWWRAHPGHRSFTILRHPLRRAWDAFATHIMPPDGFADIRAALIARHGMVAPDGEWSVETARAAFETFLSFLEANLAGQTSIRVDACWASQGRHLSAIAELATPDIVMREDSLAGDVARLAEISGMALSGVPVFPETGPVALAQILTPRIEAQAARVFRRDMLRFGFGPLGPQAA